MIMHAVVGRISAAMRLTWLLRGLAFPLVIRMVNAEKGQRQHADRVVERRL